ncbi:MAG: hypothetical protein F8N37_08140 [Telmatospirillum sp.]|nr:hypothetical protein [Telmatospirillum sp.]
MTAMTASGEPLRLKILLSHMAAHNADHAAEIAAFSGMIGTDGEKAARFAAALADLDRSNRSIKALLDLLTEGGES